MVSAAPPIDKAKVAETACQTEHATVEASTQTTTCVVMELEAFESYIEDLCIAADKLRGHLLSLTPEPEDFKRWPDVIAMERIRRGDFTHLHVDDCIAEIPTPEPEKKKETVLHVTGIPAKVKLPRDFIAAKNL